MNVNRFLVAIFVVGCGGSGLDAVEAQTDEIGVPNTCDYPQVFGNAQHTGNACPEISGMHVVALLEQDPDAALENAFSGFLQIHESPPLTSGDFVVVPGKSGFTLPADPDDVPDRALETWSTTVYRWSPSVTAPNAALHQVWSSKTSWQPVDAIIGSFGSYTNGYVMQFAPAIANGSLYIPARWGRLERRNLATGELITTINPFAGTAFDGDELTIDVNAVSVDKFNNVYYTVTSFPTSGNRAAQPRDSFLVQVRPDNTFLRTSWTQIATTELGIPSRCEYPFGVGGTGPATGPDSTPPVFGCGVQRPGFNAPVAVTADGSKLVVWSYANNAQAAAFIITIDATTMQPLHASDTRGHLLYGCGVRLGLGFRGDSGTTCALITAGGTRNFGLDPDFAGFVRYRGPDLMDNAVAVAPDGTTSIGSYDGGFQGGGDYDARGSLEFFDEKGAFVTKNEDFGWEVTSSVLRHQDGSFSYLADRNLFVPEGDISIAQYSPTQSIQVLSHHPKEAFQSFQDAHIVFGPGGDHYGVSSDGHLYKFAANGQQLEALPLVGADGELAEMFTLSEYFARDRIGRIYVSHAGRVWIVGASDEAPTPRLTNGAKAKAGKAARNASLRALTEVGPAL